MFHALGCGTQPEDFPSDGSPEADDFIRIAFRKLHHPVTLDSSGTVSAAMEGRFLGLPAVAVSLVTRNHDPRHFETAARAAVEIVARLKADPLPADTILNVNVPDVTKIRELAAAVTGPE